VAPRTHSDRLARLEQRQRARRPGVCPVVIYTMGEPLPDPRPHPEGGVFFLIPDNGRGDLAPTAQPCALRPTVNA